MLNKGTQQDPYTIAADHWVRTHAFKPDMPLLGKASKVLDHVTYPTCELVNAWFRPEAKDAWLENIATLRRAIAPQTPNSPNGAFRAPIRSVLT